MKKLWLVLFAILAFTTYATAQTDAPTAPPAASSATDSPPWVKAQAVLDATEADVKSGGVRAIGAHVPDLERVLSDGPKAFGWTGPAGGDSFVLADGVAESLIVMAAASDKSGPRHKVVAINNPYPMLSLYLGSYYNEIGKPDDALRLLDAGLKLTAVPELRLGDHLPYLISERGASLMALKRWDDALANYDDGLKITGMPDENRARLFRGRGYALTELGRLNDAEEAYRNSLKLDPGNAIAENELRYIAGLRAGTLRQPPGQLTLSHPQNTQ